MRLSRLALLLVLAAAPAAAQQPFPALRVDARLRRTLDSLTAGFEGDVGFYVRHLRTGRGAQSRADELFPTASMIKVPILAALWTGEARRIMAMNVPNDGFVPNLPDGAIVEVGGTADGDGLHPDRMPPLDPQVAEWTLPQLELQDKIVAAALTADRDLALEALVEDPLSPDDPAACRAMFDELCALQAEHPALPGRVERWFAGLAQHRPEALHAAHVVHAVHATSPEGRVARPVPIMLSRFTSAASRSSLQPSVPAGRAGMTR